METLRLQFFAFYVLFLAGAGAGLLWDLLRVARGRFRPRGVVEAGGDLLFWLAVTAVVGLALMVGNWGELRLYVGVGISLGLAVYFGLASPVMLPILRQVLELLIAFIWLIIRVLGFLVSVLIIAPVVGLWALLVGAAEQSVRLIGWLMLPFPWFFGVSVSVGKGLARHARRVWFPPRWDEPGEWPPEVPPRSQNPPVEPPLE